jgi:hypothetical protein
VAFETTSGGGHITTVVSGSGASAMLVDNITYINGSGSIANPADDGSASDIIVAAPHPALQEFTGVDPAMVVVYELDTPVVSDVVPSVTIAEDSSRSLASLLVATNPVASQAITEWQVYDTDAADTLAVSGVAAPLADSAATTITVASLASVALDTGATAGTDTIEARACNGSYWGDWQSLTAIVSGVSPEPPTLTYQTPNQAWQQGQRISFTLPANTFTDPQGETLAYSAVQADGQALPVWLSFNGTTDTFSGTVPVGTESFTVKVTATDTSSLSASETFGITVAAAAPVVSQQTPNQAWTEGTSISLPLPSDTFTDPQGEALTYTATQASGQALPAWLSFNPQTEAFSGTAPATAQSLMLKVTATDTSGLSTSESFTASIRPPTAPRPAISVTEPTPDQSWDDGQAVAFVLPSNTFTDALGEKMTFAAYEVYGPNVTSWLHFNSATDEFFGNVPNSQTGSVTLAVIASDASHAVAADIFNVAFVQGTSHMASGPTGGVGLDALLPNVPPEGLVLHLS